MMHFRSGGGLTRHCVTVIPPSVAGQSYECDFMADEIVLHVAKSFGYQVEKVVIADCPPANFARDLERLMAADLMAFDLSGSNPNVCVLAGLRYMTGRPMISFVANGGAVPHLLAHTRAIPYVRDRLRECEAEFIRRLSRIDGGDWIEGRPFFEVLAPDEHRVRIGEFELTRNVLADIEDRVHSGGKSQDRVVPSSSNSAMKARRSTRYGS